MLIGDIQLSNNRTAMLSCKLPKNSVLRAVLLDSTSRARWEHQFMLDKTARSLELNFPRLSKGTYHLWLTVDGRTFIRELNVDGSRFGGMIHHLLGLFH